jgi:dinuclear metal center YbgI/SA1388 family protein
MAKGGSVMANWLIKQLEAWAPCHWAEEWDNVGLLLGDANRPAQRVLVALDVTDATVQEAIENKYDFIVCHHPLIHDPLKKINTDTPTGRKIIALLSAGISLYCIHTNLDKAPGGVNDCLFEKLGLQNPSPLVDCECKSPCLGLVGTLPAPMTLAQFAAFAKNALNENNIRYAGNPDKEIFTVGLCGGDASHPRYWKAAQDKKCDVFLTGDLRYHGTQDALEAGLVMLDITHYAGEIGVVEAIVRYIQQKAAQENVPIIIEASKINGQIFNY